MLIPWLPLVLIFHANPYGYVLRSMHRYVFTHSCTPLGEDLNPKVRHVWTRVCLSRTSSMSNPSLTKSIEVQESHQVDNVKSPELAYRQKIGDVVRQVQ